MAALAEDDQTRQVLTWIGFIITNQRELVLHDTLTSYTGLRILKPQDINSLSASFSSRPHINPNRQIIFDSRKTKKLQVLMY